MDYVPQCVWVHWVHPATLNEAIISWNGQRAKKQLKDFRSAISQCISGHYGRKIIRFENKYTTVHLVKFKPASLHILGVNMKVY